MEDKMKKLLMSSILITASFLAMNSVNLASQEVSYDYQKMFAMTLGYDKSMSEKTIKAAVIDSYFRNVAKNGKIVRWNKKTFPLNVYVEDCKSVPSYYREIVMSAYQSWQRASEGLVRFNFVETPEEADMKCYFKNTDNKDSIGMQAFSVNGNTITESIIVFNRVDNKGYSHDSKQLYSFGKFTGNGW